MGSTRVQLSGNRLGERVYIRQQRHPPSADVLHAAWGASAALARTNVYRTLLLCTCFTVPASPRARNRVANEEPALSAQRRGP